MMPLLKKLDRGAIKMEIKMFSNEYAVKKLTNDDVDDIYRLCIKNELYYQHCPPLVTKESILEDMVVLPPNKTLNDKYYVGFYQENKLIAIMDLIDGYPEKSIIFIGFFMIEKTIQNQGIASNIINDLVNYLKTLNYQEIRLAWVKTNPQAKHFWLKNHFVALKETISNTNDQVILASRSLR